MKPLATIGDAVLHGGPAWRADLRANGIDRRPPPPSSERLSQPDRGLVEQPGEGTARRMEQQPLVRQAAGEPAKAPGATEEERVDVPKKTRVAKKTKVYLDEPTKREAVRRVMSGEMAKDVARSLGVHQSTLSPWLRMYGNKGEKTLVSAAPRTAVAPPAALTAASADIAAKNLVEMLTIYINAAVDSRVEAKVEGAIKERMKRLL